jgi:hypothetical protein
MLIIQKHLHTNNAFKNVLAALMQVLETTGLGEFTPSYILHTCAFGTYLLGGGYLPCRKDYKVMVFYM